MIKKCCNLGLIIMLSSCGAGVSDNLVELPNKLKYLKEGNKCSNAIIDEKGFIKYPYVSNLKYNDSFINFEQYYSLECEKNYSDLLGNDSIFLQQRSIYTIYNLNNGIIYSDLNYTKYQELFTVLKVEKELYIE